MPRAARDVMTPVDGWVRDLGEAQWREARFALDADSKPPILHLQGRTAPNATDVDLNSITVMDELAPSHPGLDRVELELAHGSRFQAAWPASFTAATLRSLQSTLAPRAVDVTATTPPAAAGGVGVPPVPAKRDGRALTGVIGALALIGCGAVVAGALTLAGSDDPPPYVSTEVLSQTTIREATTVPTTAPSATTTTTTTTLVPTETES